MDPIDWTINVLAVLCTVLLSTLVIVVMYVVISAFIFGVPINKTICVNGYEYSTYNHRQIISENGGGIRCEIPVLKSE